MNQGVWWVQSLRSFRLLQSEIQIMIAIERIKIYNIQSIQGCTQNLMWVGSFQEKVDLFDGAGVQSTPSMQSMLKLGGSGGMPPQENLKNRYQNTRFGDISAT